MTAPATPEEAREGLSGTTLLAAVYSRTFGVCVACPRGGHLPGCGTLAAHWFTDPQYGRYGLCEAHHKEWGHRS